VVLLIFAYAVPSIAGVRQETRFYYDSSQRVRHLLEGVAYAEKLHPGKTILLKDVDDQLFWDCILDAPFRLLGPANILVAPEARPFIHADPHLAPIDPLFLPMASVRYMLKQEQLVVYSAERPPLRNVTREYADAVLTQQATDELSTQVDLTTPYFDGQLGDGWYQPEKEYRWMGRHAVLYLPGPSRPGQKVYLHGARVDQQEMEGPLHLTVTINGKTEAVNSVEPGRREFRFEYNLRPELIGKAKVEIGLTVDKAFYSGQDKRELGLLFRDAGLR
jgi:hypothetical protein